MHDPLPGRSGRVEPQGFAIEDRSHFPLCLLQGNGGLTRPPALLAFPFSTVLAASAVDVVVVVVVVAVGSLHVAIAVAVAVAAYA